MTAEEIRSVINVIKENSKDVASGKIDDLIILLQAKAKLKQEEKANKIREKYTITADTYEDFCQIAECMLHEDLEEETPHGEYGGDIEGVFYWDSRVFKCRYEPDWNRHDKQYYFIDNYGGNKLKVEEIK